MFSKVLLTLLAMNAALWPAPERTFEWRVILLFLKRLLFTAVRLRVEPAE